MSPRARVVDGLLLFALAILAQGWTLGLTFQLDDFVLLAHPGELFALVPRGAGDALGGVPPFMMRWPLWALWWAIAEAGGEPRDPVLFHAVGVALHGVVVVLLAGVVRRLAPAGCARSAAWLAGALFAVSGGAIQAVSWTSAWADLLFPLFGLFALGAFLRSRERPGEARRVRGFLWLLVALATKTPAIVLAPGILLVLWARDRVEGARLLSPTRGLGKDALAVGAAVAAWLQLRWVYLGSVELRYGPHTAPGWRELPALAADAARALGQALFPWNRDPLFRGDEPWLAERLAIPFGASAPLFAACACVPVVVAGVALVPALRGRVAVAAALALGFALPGAVLYEGFANNSIARALYLPMMAACAALGMVGGALWADERRRPLGLLVVAVLALFFLDGRRHVVTTEGLADGLRRETFAVVEGFRRERAELEGGAGSLVVFVVDPDPGFGAIPGTGGLLPRAFAPPFVEGAAVDVRVGPFERALMESLDDPSLAQASVALATPAPGRSALATPEEWWERSGRENRADRALRARGPVRPGLGPGGAAGVRWTLERGPATERWRAGRPLPMHALRWIELRLSPGARVEGRLVLGAGARSHAFAFDVPAAEEQRVVATELPFDPIELVAPPVESVAWTAADPLLGPPRLGVPLPELALVAPPSEASLELVAASPPRFEVRLPAEVPLPAHARLELRFPTAGIEASLYADVDLPAGASPGGPFELRPTVVHPDPAVPARDAPAVGVPWSTFVRSSLLPTLRSRDRSRGVLAWRVTLYWPGGRLPAARSPLRRATFTLPPPAPPPPPEED